MLITALPDLARNVGVPRIVQGIAITSPTGDPARTPQGESQLRAALVMTAIRAAQTAVQEPTLFTLLQGE